MIKFIALYRMIPTQKHLNHSITDDEVKVMNNFLLRVMKLEKIDIVIFLTQIHIKIIKHIHCLFKHSHYWDLTNNFQFFCKSY